MGSKVENFSKVKLMQRTIQLLSGVSKANRYDVTAEIDRAIMGLGGWITGHGLFSNILVTFRFEMPTAQFPALADRLAASGVHLDEDSLAWLEAVAIHSPNSMKEIPASIAVTFLHNEPDLRHEVPAVPG